MSYYNWECESCGRTWEMTAGCVKRAFCPYCGIQEILHSVTYDNIKAKIERELISHATCPDYYSVTDDFSYWWGYIDAMEKKKLVTNEESIELNTLKDKFKR